MPPMLTIINLTQDIHRMVTPAAEASGRLSSCILVKRIEAGGGDGYW
jgi:hypothetical protein